MNTACDRTWPALFTLVALGLLVLGPGAAAQEADPPASMTVPLSERVLWQPGPYRLTDDSKRQPGVPRGEVTKHTLTDSTVYPGTIREVWVYVPAQYDPDGDEPAAVMVFQDGHAYVGDDSDFHATTVFDNLIAKGEMPITIGIFLEPGHRGDTLPEGYWNDRNNRSVEYDTPDETYARFLIRDILPQVGRKYRLTRDPGLRAIAGHSSGGICAFKCAWHRPDAFRKVFSTVGSFTNIRGGHVYPQRVREERARPIRVFLQDGENDLDNRFGSWWQANQEMAKALAFKDRYDYRFLAGDGGHDAQQGAAIFPDAMRWLWRGWDEQ